MSYEEIKNSDGSFLREWRYEDGRIHRTEWRDEDGRIHRELAPAVICYYPDGSIKAEYFYINGKSHRELGPADIYYNGYGSIHDEWFYLDGKFFGSNKKGFWKLWDLLNHDQRQKPELLKYLAKFS
jgi:antitoxin component YwqK of YwqJK toxin-antitoxin module